MQLNKLTNKVNFIEGVLNKSITPEKYTDEELEKILVERKFDKYDDSFDYLLNMSMRMITKRSIENNKKKIEELKIAISELQKQDSKMRFIILLSTQMLTLEKFIDFARKFVFFK